MERVVPGGLGPATIAMTEPGGFARAIASAEPSLRRFLRQRGVGSSDLNDILQATWLIAWQHRREFAGRGSASGWLLAIARTAHRNWRQSTPCLIDELNDRI